MRRYFKGPAKLVWRLIILVAGLTLLLIGVIMIFTPGPAIVFIPAGLGLLATEYQWARDLLHRARPMIEAAIEKAKRTKRSGKSGTDPRSADAAPVSQNGDNSPKADARP